MSLLGIHIKVFNDEQAKAVKAALNSAGHDVTMTVLTPAQQLEHGLEASPVGVFIQSEIQIVQDGSLSNLEKFEAVVAKAVPFAIDFFAKGGVKTIAADVESAVRATVQGVFNGIFSKSVPNLLAEVEGLLGIK